MPSPNLVTLNMEEILMNRSDRNFSNPNASLKISMGIQCGRFLYGNDCMTKCQGFQSGNFYCSRDGRNFFNPGWTGPDCQITNPYEKLKCARGATCRVYYTYDKANCMCSGREATECYQNYIPCLPNPCLNNGECVSHENNSHQCKCVRGNFGDLCEKTVELGRIELVVIGSIIGLIMIQVVIAIVFGCIYLTRRAEKLQNKGIHMDRMREDMDNNHYTFITDNRNRSSYDQRFYADEIQRSEKE